MHEPSPTDTQILIAEHGSLLSARGLVYNEAFTRVSTFLTFLSMSFVALALLTQAMGFTRDFLVVAAIVLSFDFLIGVTTFTRILDVIAEHLRAMHRMNRIRHAYIQIAPHVAPYFTTGAHDDLASVMTSYSVGGPKRSMLADVAYAFSTSLGQVLMIAAMVGGVLASVITLAAGGTGWLAVAVAIGATLVVLLSLGRWAAVEIPRSQAALPVRFPAPPTESEPSQPVE